MSDKLLKILGTVGLILSCCVLYFGANMPTTEIANLASKVLGVIGSLLSSIAVIVGIKKSSDDDKE